MKKWIKDVVLVTIGMVTIGVPVMAGGYLPSRDVSYRTDYNENVTNVEEALDILTNQVKEINNTGNSTSSDILSGKIAYVNGTKVVGTIESKSASTYTPGTSDQTIDAGKYLSGEQTILGDVNLIADNIAKGISIFGVTGTYSGNTEFSVYASKSNVPTFTNIPIGRYLLIANGYVNWDGGQITNYQGISNATNISIEKNVFQQQNGNGGSLTVYILKATADTNSFISKSNGSSILIKLS